MLSSATGDLQPVQARRDEVCGNGADDNCNGIIDEFCFFGGGGGPRSPPPPGTGPEGPPNPPKQPQCLGQAGEDPIVLASRSAVSEPHTDFSAEAIVALSVTRTYSSADASVTGALPPGVFGRGWRHEWEASLSCNPLQNGTPLCTVALGTSPSARFVRSGDALSLDGAETWTIYVPYATSQIRAESRDILAARPGGLWVLFLADGREFHFRTVCDACSVGEQSGPLCRAPDAGGRARLVRVVDPRGNSVLLSYDRPGGILLGLADELGHSLQLRAADACQAGLARELAYEGMAIASYSYATSDGVDLTRVAAGDGGTVRSYTYSGLPGRLRAVLNEAAEPVAEFTYDLQGRAIGLQDRASSVQVDYADPAGRGERPSTRTTSSRPGTEVRPRVVPSSSWRTTRQTTGVVVERRGGPAPRLPQPRATNPRGWGVRRPRSSCLWSPVRTPIDDSPAEGRLVD